MRGSGRGRQDDEENEENEEDEEGYENEDPDQEGPNETGKNVKSDLAPETQEDLRPFPLNRFFRSEPVLSEELRHEIFRRVAEKNQSVREVSIALNVEMARVGAVVRLMLVEQDWLRHVSCLGALLSFPLSLHNDEKQQKIRLVFKTTTWLQTCFRFTSLISHLNAKTLKTTLP